MGYSWMSYSAAAKYIPEAKRYRVSGVARSSGGFMGNYKRAGSATKMNKRPLGRSTTGGKTWGQKRENFIKRHLAQYKKNKTYRRWLALVMWAYKPGSAPSNGQKKTRPRSKKSSTRRSSTRRSSTRRSSTRRR